MYITRGLKFLTYNLV